MKGDCIRRCARASFLWKRWVLWQGHKLGLMEVEALSQSVVVGVRPLLGVGERISFARNYSLDPEGKRSTEMLTVEW